jgi:phosphohistidine phosphatase SixA
MILRHADADRGRDYNTLDKGDGPANWWKSCDTTLARQLNTKGRERSVELGRIFKDLRFPITRVISSEFCRAKETATLINAGPKVITDGRINHPDYNVSGSSLFQGMLEVVKEQPVDNKMTLLEAHHPINERRSELAGFPEVIPFPWTGGYFVKVEQDHSVSFEGAVSYPMFKYFRDKKMNRL